MALNEAFEQAQASVWYRNPLPSLDNFMAVILSEETQKFSTCSNAQTQKILAARTTSTQYPYKLNKRKSNQRKPFHNVSCRYC